MATTEAPEEASSAANGPRPTEVTNQNEGLISSCSVFRMIGDSRSDEDLSWNIISNLLSRGCLYRKVGLTSSWIAYWRSGR